MKEQSKNRKYSKFAKTASFSFFYSDFDSRGLFLGLTDNASVRNIDQVKKNKKIQNIRNPLIINTAFG